MTDTSNTPVDPEPVGPDTPDDGDQEGGNEGDDR